MRVKAKTTFITESKVVHAGQEVDVPESVGIYLLAQDAVIKVDGGKGVQADLTPDTAKVTEQAAKAVETLKTKTKAKN